MMEDKAERYRSRCPVIADRSLTHILVLSYGSAIALTNVDVCLWFALSEKITPEQLSEDVEATRNRMFRALERIKKEAGITYEGTRDRTPTVIGRRCSDDHTSAPLFNGKVSSDPLQVRNSRSVLC
jgi:hypothetical protein